VNDAKQVLVFGATGHMGGAATRELLRRGWRVRAVTRNPGGEKAVSLAALGAEVVAGEMEDRASLEAAFDGIKRVFSVQSWTIAGVEGEARQGKLVADVAHSARVEHLVFGSAGTGEVNTGVPHFESKIEVEAHMRKLDLPVTIIRPGPFMELLTEKDFYPAMGAWGTEPKIVGWHTPKPWVAVRDIGVAIANAFDDRNRWLGREVDLFGDVKSLAQCQDVFVAIDGKKPFRLPMPLWLFGRMAGNELVIMWRWLAGWIAQKGPDHLWEMVASGREICPELLDLESWLRLERAKGSNVDVESRVRVR
jgi:uncharacterized protein YbjT (DUF2867 family)